mgnify:CR=1 FL=1
MGQLQFITDVPFTQGFDNRQRRDDEHALNQMRLNTSDWALNESMRKSGEAQGQDIALGRAVQGSLPAVPAQAPAPIPAMPAIPPVPAGIAPAAHAQRQPSAASEAAQSQAVPAQASPLAAASTSRGFRTNVARHLAMAPGGGAAAAQHLQGAMESEEVKEEKFLEIATKNPDMAVQYATMNGLKVDENMMGLIRNRKAMSSISGLLDASKALYPGDHNAAVRAQYLQQQFGKLNEMAKSTQGVSQADVMGGYVSPDMPTPAVKPQWAPYPTNVQGQDGKKVGAVFDPNTSTFSETDYSSVDRGVGRGTGAVHQAIKIADENGNPIWGVLNKTTGQVTPTDQPVGVDAKSGQFVHVPVKSANGQDVWGVLNKTTGTIEETTTPVGYTSRGAAGRTPAQIQVVDYLVEHGVAKDHNEAWQMAQTAKSNPQGQARVVASIYGSMKRDIMDRRSDKQKMEAARTFVDELTAAPAADGAQPSPIPSPTKSRAGKMQRSPTDGKDYPVVASQQEYAALRPGEVYYHAEKKTFLRKGQ